MGCLIQCPAPKLPKKTQKETPAFSAGAVSQMTKEDDVTDDAPTTRPRRDYFDHPITPDEMMAAARQHERYLRTVLPREYQMRVFPDGSVYFRNVIHPGYSEYYTLAEIQEQSRWFRLSPHRKLWQHVFHIWA